MQVSPIVSALKAIPTKLKIGEGGWTWDLTKNSLTLWTIVTTNPEIARLGPSIPESLCPIADWANDYLGFMVDARLEDASGKSPGPISFTSSPAILTQEHLVKERQGRLWRRLSHRTSGTWPGSKRPLSCWSELSGVSGMGPPLWPPPACPRASWPLLGCLQRAEKQ